MVLVKKCPFFQIFFLGNICQKNVCYHILEWSKNGHILGYKNKMFKKSKNSHFAKGINPWFLSRNGHFLTFFFIKYTPGKWLLWYSRAKNAFLGYKNKNFKEWKNWHFTKGVTHGFGQKMAIFLTFFFRKYRPRKFLLWYSRAKKRFSRL